MADLASTVGVTAPAIYRHYSDKQALLVAAISTGLDEVEYALAELESIPWPAAVRRLAAVAIVRRDLWILLQRELRHLDARRRKLIDRRFDVLVGRLHAALADAAPGLDHGSLALRVTSALAVLSSPSLYRVDLPAADHAELLAAAAVAASLSDVSGAPTTESPSAGAARPGPATGRADSAEAGCSRSEELLRTSLELFHERGYAAVSLDDIGAQVGMAGPSIYHHFATKADLLVAAFTRATEQLNAAYAPGTEADLDVMVRRYVDLGVRERLLFGVFVLEAINLPPTVGRRIKRSLDRDIAAWSDALVVTRPSLTGPQRLVLVHAARAVVNDVVRIGRLHDRERIAEELHDVTWSVLCADPSTIQA